MVLCTKVVSPRLGYAPTLTKSKRSRSTGASSDYQFLQRSKLPTMHFQRSLPRLPIPPLEKTCERYLAALQPILDHDQHDQARKMVDIFFKGAGMDLQALLKRTDESNKHTSYISEPWFDMYLSDRKPLPLNYNPLLVMNPDPRPGYQTQLLRATNLVISSLRFGRSLKEEVLEPEVFHINAAKSDSESFRRWTRIAPSAIATYVAYAFKAFPLDMSQYHHLFGVSRIPQLGKDHLVQNKESRHIMVLMGGNIYSVDVLDEQHQIVPPDLILGRLQTVIELNSMRGPAEFPLGILTTGQRDIWAHTREHLLNGISLMNANLLEHEVDSALFCLCLDSSDDAVYNESNQVPLLKNMLAGYGRNRWFDKSVSLIVSADGTAAINFEHSWGDGVAVLRYFNEIYKDTIKDTYVHPNTEARKSGGTVVRPVEFEIDDKLKSEVEQANSANSKIINNLEMHILQNDCINKGFCKSKSVSPDSVMQLAFQLAYKRAFDQYVGTYESCSTAAFRHGRTETVRPCTMATKTFCDAMMSSNSNKPNASELLSLINQCSNIHTQLTKEAAMGQGFDRHMFALRHVALKNNISVPNIYESEPYRKLNYNIISTSTLSSEALLAGAFGPVVDDGLGIGYSINSVGCGTVVTSYKNSDSDVEKFISSLKQALIDIYDTLNTNKN